MTTIELKTSDLINIYKKLSHSMGTEESRPYLNGVCLDYRDNLLTAVSTDGHRLSKLELPVTVISESKDFSYILPKELIKQLSQVKIKRGEDDYNANIEIDEDNVFINWRNGQFRDKLIDGTYPDWRRVIPEPVEAPIGFNPAYLMAMAKAAMDSKTGRVALHIKDDTSPMLVKEVDNPNVEYVLMPMKI